MSYLERDTYGIYKNSNVQGVPTLMGVNTFLGGDIYNRQEENLGDIKEIMLNIHTGRVAYAVLSFGGFLGIGEKLFAVPWNALKLDHNKKCFVLNVEKEHLKSAPGFDKDNWPNMADPVWEKEINSYYETQLNNDAMPVL